RQREVAADRAGGGVSRVRRADRRAGDSDRALALEGQRQGRPRRDERDQLAEERLLGVLGVVLLGQRAVDRYEPRLPHNEPAPLEAAEDLACEPARQRVRLDQNQGPLDRQTARSLRAFAARRREGLRLAELDRS